MRVRKHHAGEELEFQIAPMVDVLLVVLVFFIMITSASVLQGDPDIVLPVASDATKPEKSKAEAVLNLHWVTAGKSGFVTMDKVRFDKLDALGKKLAAMSAGKKNFRVVIRADRTLPAIFVQRVLGACADAGVSDTVFTALNHD